MNKKIKILNLTQHDAVEKQKKLGVVEPQNKEEIRKLLTFEELPTPQEILKRAEAIANEAKKSGCKAAMIGGAPYLMPALERALAERGIAPLYAFSKRNYVDKHLPDGRVIKQGVFEFIDFVKTPLPTRQHLIYLLEREAEYYMEKSAYEGDDSDYGEYFAEKAEKIKKIIKDLRGVLNGQK